MKTLRRTAAGVFVLVALFGCSDSSVREAIPGESLIVPGQKLGDFAAMNEPEVSVVARGPESVQDILTNTRFYHFFEQGDGSFGLTIGVCVDSGTTYLALAHNIPKFEGLHTEEGVTFATSRSEARALLGVPDTTVEDAPIMIDGERVLLDADRYRASEGEGWMELAYLDSDKSRAWQIAVFTRFGCEQ